MEGIATNVVDGFDPSEINQLQALSQILSSQEKVATFGAVDSQAITDSQESQDEDDMYLKYLCTLQAEEDGQMEQDIMAEEVAGPSRPRQQLQGPSRPIQRPAIATQ